MELLIHPLRRRQRGLSLLYAMLALVVLALATVALIRSVSTGSVVAGNLAFKQEAAAASDQAVRQAVLSLTNRLTNNGQTGLDADASVPGYYASSNELVDVTGSQISVSTRRLVRWDNDFCGAQPSGTFASCDIVPATLGNINGNDARYVIFRMCDRSGDPISDTTINCARPLAASATSGSNEARDYGGGSGVSATVTTPYYRVLVRVRGPRNTTSYTETIIHF